MILWNIQALQAKLKDTLSEKEDFQYLFVYTLLGMTLLFLPVYYTFYDILLNSLSVILMCGLLIYLYKINSKHFLSRFISLSIVVGIRSTIYILIPLLILLIIAYILVYGENIPESTTLLDVLCISLYYIGFGYMMRKSFIHINTPKI